MVGIHKYKSYYINKQDIKVLLFKTNVCINNTTYFTLLKLVT